MQNALDNFGQIGNTNIAVDDEAIYKIGMVSKITGIGTETLRAWERRYEAVVPKRSDSGDRNYTRNDVAKLLLLKRLIDNGSSIGSVARLEVEELKTLAEQCSQNSNEPDSFAQKTSLPSAESCNVILLGDSFPLRILDGLEEVRGINIVGTYDNIDDFKNQPENDKQANVIVVERPTINSKTNEEVQQIIEATGAWHVVLIYGFANQELIQSLQTTQTTIIRSSVDVQELARLCISHTGGSEKLPSLVQGSTLLYEQTIPSRIFSNKQLTKLAAISNTIKCECPNHISDLISSMVAFEIYSAECENKNDQDEALHGYLHATTAQARSMMEEALSHLIRVEGIDIHL